MSGKEEEELQGVQLGNRSRGMSKHGKRTKSGRARYPSDVLKKVKKIIDDLDENAPLIKERIIGYSVSSPHLEILHDDLREAGLSARDTMRIIVALLTERDLMSNNCYTASLGWTGIRFIAAVMVFVLQITLLSLLTKGVNDIREDDDAFGGKVNSGKFAGIIVLVVYFLTCGKNDARFTFAGANLAMLGMEFWDKLIFCMDLVANTLFPLLVIVRLPDYLNTLGNLDICLNVISILLVFEIDDYFVLPTSIEILMDEFHGFLNQERAFKISGGCLGSVFYFFYLPILPFINGFYVISELLFEHDNNTEIADLGEKATGVIEIKKKYLGIRRDPRRTVIYGVAYKEDKFDIDRIFQREVNTEQGTTQEMWYRVIHSEEYPKGGWIIGKQNDEETCETITDHLEEEKNV